MQISTQNLTALSGSCPRWPRGSALRLPGLRFGSRISGPYAEILAKPSATMIWPSTQSVLQRRSMLLSPWLVVSVFHCALIPQP